MSFFNNAKSVTVAGKVVSKLELAGKVIWEAVKYKNWVRHSTEADGVTVYNNGLGYKDGYRIRSGGAEATQANATCTGFIPVSGGDIVRLAGWTFDHVTAANAISLSDSSFTNIGQLTSQGSSYGIIESAYSTYGWSSVVESDGVWTWVVPPAASGVAYIRISGFDNSDDFSGASMIVTINEEITE